MSGAIWLTSYPKSGNTWVRLALRSLQKGGAAIALDDIARFGNAVTMRGLFDTVLGADAGLLTSSELEALRPTLHDAYFGPLARPALCKVHDRWSRTTAGRPIFDAPHTRATIYIVRDPRDVAVSWARFSARSFDWAIHFMGLASAQLANDHRGNDGHIAQRLGTWSDHVTSWIDDSGLDPLVVRYEDLHADLPAALSCIAARIGWSWDEAALAGAVAATGFDLLSAQEDRHGFMETPERAARFFVSGRTGGWRDILTPDQAARIERDHAAVMQRLGYL